MPNVIEKNFAVIVQLSAEDLKELEEFIKQARKGSLRNWWLNTLQEWTKKV